MKIKVNEDKQTISIKGLSILEFSVIETLLNHVRMGQEKWDGGASAVPFAFSQAVEEAFDGLVSLELPVVELSAVPSEEIEDLTIVISSPTLEVYVD
jgi:hypothetical protein